VTKTGNTLGWVFAVLTFLLMAASASDKIRESQHALTMGSSFGLSAEIYRLLGVIELISALLFLVPRTAVLGLLLLASYLGGAIATHLQHGQPIAFPVAIEVFVWVTAVIRLPEITSRLRGR
jgi:hypothetical protein